jgi:hypothetical protein
MGNCILNNSGTAANTYGVNMSGTASMQFGVCTFNIPSAQATNRAINGVAGNMVLYSLPVFQYGTTNKISTLGFKYLNHIQAQMIFQLSVLKL